MSDTYFDLEASLDSLTVHEEGRWIREACGVTSHDTPIPALVHVEAYTPFCSRHRILLVGGFSGGREDVNLAIRAITLVGDSSRVALSSIPCANPDGFLFNIGPANGSGGNPGVGYPPNDGYYFDKCNPEIRYLWRWVCFMAPDIVLEVRSGLEVGWESTDEFSDLGIALGATRLGPTDSMLAALAIGRPSGLFPVPGFRLTSNESVLEGQLGDFMGAILSRKSPAKSKARDELDARRTRDPLNVAQLLAKEYGHSLDPIVYTQGVAISGRLRLASLTDSVDEISAEIRSMVDPIVSDSDDIVEDGAGGSILAGLVWCDELSDLTGDSKYGIALVSVADRYNVSEGGHPPSPCDPDYRAEDMFFSAAILGRAYRLTGDTNYLDILTKFLLDAEIQQPNGLFWHSRSTPYFWGRGNGFAALGFSEALSYIPEDYVGRDEILGIHVRHLEAMKSCQLLNGMLTEVLGFPGSYPEHTVTCMLGYSVARGLIEGWLDDRYRPMADLAWSGVAERISLGGDLVDGCTGTGPQADLRSYLDRPAEFGHDDRTGNLALWFAVEMERLARQQAIKRKYVNC